VFCAGFARTKHPTFPLFFEKLQEKLFWMGELTTLGFAPVPSQTHFFLLPVENAAGFRLLPRGVLVRDGTSFGLPGHV
jgi:hypothetical protein